jgi:DNA-directed RNA polymerase subunit RPC12/RpoP
MSDLTNGTITCAMCRAHFDVARAKPILASRRMRVHDVYACPNCGYYVSVVRVEALAAH